MESWEKIEYTILNQVKFINVMLQEIKERNKVLREELGMSYAKYIGLGTPYEEAIHALRQVKKEFDSYLKIARSELLKRYEVGHKRERERERDSDLE